MIDTIGTVVLVLILIGFEQQQQRLIKVAEKTRYSKYFVVIAISITTVILFWSSNVQTNAKIGAILLLLVAVAFMKQGLGADKVVTFGSVGKASEYKRYEEVVVNDEENGGSSVTFYGHKSGHFSLDFSESRDTLEKFLRDNLPETVKLVTAAEFEASKQKREHESESLQARRIEAVRNRKRLSVKKFVKGK